MINDEASILIRGVLASNIRTLREQSGLSQGRLAEMVGVNRSYLNQIEQGRENMSLNVLVKLADGLDVPIALLFNGLEADAPRKLSKRTVTYAAVKLPRSTS